MPVLRNPRHEAFARAIFRGIFEPDLFPTHGHAYKAAGYRASGIGDAGGAAEVNACKLLKKTKIFERIAELQRLAAEDMGETIDKCVSELNEIKDASMSNSEKPAYSAAVSAVMGKAKILGFITDKTEVKNGNIDFSTATSYSDIGRKLLESVGYASPSDDDISLALEAHQAFTEQLEAIAERAQSLSAEQ
jgi:hypothetical protein